LYSRGQCSVCKQRLWINPAAESTAILCGRCKLGLPALEASTCGICFDPLEDRIQFMKFSNHSWSHTRCSHLRNFCSGCLRGHVASRLTDNCWNIRCPFVGSKDERCPYVLVEADLKKVLKRPEDRSLLVQYENLRVADHGYYLRQILSSGKSSLDPESSESSGFENWAGASCQACPRCLVVVRKEDGCDHMVCRCGTEFCFRCGGPYCESLGPPCVCSAMVNRQCPQLGFWLQFHDRLNENKKVNPESLDKAE